MALYLDCDTTPPIRSRYTRGSGLTAAKVEALALIRNAEGQIGIYEHAAGGSFHGYVIRYRGQEPFFEEPAPEEQA